MEVTRSRKEIIERYFAGPRSTRGRFISRSSGNADPAEARKRKRRRATEQRATRLSFSLDPWNARRWKRDTLSIRFRRGPCLLA